MIRRINILEAHDFKEKGMFFYCTNDDIQSISKDEILAWFGNAKKIIFDEASTKEFLIKSIEPMISFTNNTAVMIKIDKNDVPTGVYPTTATIE